MKQIVRGFTIAGGLIPVVLMLGKFLELKINPETVPYSSLYGFYLWPTSIMLLGSSGVIDLRSVAWLVLSILANMFLYFVIGFFGAQSIVLMSNVGKAKQ